MARLMVSPNSTERILEIERQILRALCSPRAAFRTRGVRELANHRWREPEHRIVYEALGKIRPKGGSLREQLAAQTTRMGFPDVDWTAYFGGNATTSSELPKLLRELRAAEREKT